MTSPPRVPKLTILRRMIGLARNPIQGFNRYIREYGHTFHLDIGGSRSSFVTIDPDLIQHVLQRNHRNYEKSEIQTDQMGKYLGYGLLTNSGSHWLQQRRLIQPGFHRQRMQMLVTEMQHTIEQHCKELDEAAAQEAIIPVEEFTLQLAFRIIARAIFTDGYSKAQMEELDATMTKIQEYIVYPIRLPFLRPFAKISGYDAHYIKLSKDIGDQIMERIKARRKSAESKDDLLQMLIDSRYEDTGEPMEDQQLIDEIMILFAAGHETSANALAWTIYLLAKHPDVKEKLREEIARELADNPKPDMAALKALPYLTAVLEESMRLYPPAWISDRVALGDDQFNDLKIPKDIVVVPYFYGLHRNPELYEDPHAFKPERMLPAAKKKRHPYAYLPFGGGPRLCIGLHFAMLEMQLAMIYLLRHYEFTAVDNREILPKPFLTLRASQSIQMRVTKLSLGK